MLDEGVDGESLALLTERALESMVDKVGPRMKLIRIINLMKTRADTGELDPDSVGSGLVPSAQSTIMIVEDSECTSRSPSPLSTSSQR